MAYVKIKDISDFFKILTYISPFESFLWIFGLFLNYFRSTDPGTSQNQGFLYFSKILTQQILEEPKILRKIQIF